MTPKNLKVIAWNVNSIRSKVKQEEVRHLLSEHKPHLLLLCETKLNNDNVVQFPGYSIYRNDRLSDSGGGTAILIEEHIKHEVLNTPLLEASEATSVGVALGNSKSLIVSSFYCSKDLLKNDLLKLMDMHSNVFMGGDFNAKHCYWHNCENNANGNALYRFLIEEDVAELVHPNQHTCYRSKTNPSTIDLALAKGVSVTSSTVTEPNPDHCPVEYILKVEEDLSYESPIAHFMYNEANWDRFKESIDEKLIHHPTSSDIDGQVAYLTEAISSAMNECIPKKCFVSKNQFPKQLKDLIAEKKRLRRVYFRRKFNDPALKMEIHRLNTVIKNSINTRDSKILMNKLKQIRPDTKMYGNIGKLLGAGKKAIPELKACDGTLVSNLHDKANAIAKVYDEIHRQNENMGDPGFDAVVMTEVFSFSQMTPADLLEPSFTNAEEIWCILKSIKNKKSYGPDAIPNIVLKKLPRSAHEYLANMINCILGLGHYPEPWKIAYILPIPKPGKPANEAKNFRPISLLNCLSKILEKVLHVRILEYCDANGILPNNQFGFRSRHSTVHALIRLIEEAIVGFNDRKVTIAAFLDIEKAFDTMWVEGLIYKMIKMKFPAYLIKIILSYLKGRSFQVKLGDQLSDPILVNNGVPQGSILGPLLFIVFMTDLPIHMNTSLTVFADDTSTFSTRVSHSRAKSNVQSHLDKLHKYYQMWKIKVNVEKSEALFIQRCNRMRAHNESAYGIQMDGTQIPYKKSVRFLGYHVQPNLKHNEHVNRVLLKAHTGLHKLYPIMKVNNGICQEVKVKLYTTILRPVIAYAVAVWHNLPKYLIMRLKVFENKCLRMAINFRRSRTNYKFVSTEQLHKMTRVPKLNVYLHNLARNMLAKTYSHDNIVINKFGNFSYERIADFVYKPPHSLVRGHDSKLLSI